MRTITWIGRLTGGSLVRVTLIACPDPECGATAELVDLFTVDSTSGRCPHVRTRCVHRHHFILPADLVGTPVELSTVESRSR